jgi:hypothetical protein
MCLERGVPFKVVVKSIEQSLLHVIDVSQNPVLESAFQAKALDHLYVGRLTYCPEVC